MTFRRQHRMILAVVAEEPTRKGVKPYPGDNIYHSGNGKQFLLPEREYKARFGHGGGREGSLCHVPNAGVPKGAHLSGD